MSENIHEHSQWTLTERPHLWDRRDVCSIEDIRENLALVIYDLFQ